jgi:hypothetical protein
MKSQEEQWLLATSYHYDMINILKNHMYLYVYSLCSPHP